ncbi:Pentatricopeptide repeat-containing protein [Camellia lanceoleosa]|uniref:Pentatricopeptide repeat-containing protein n=1 Tax=Camellia lanceoleosa TaxID=1840588 RepID=A0ACC0IZG2_9ERIC|nr:Pentatricopeptide repeat-containing protein [Camellia lanceoleosa]
MFKWIFFHANSGANRLVGGLFKGRTLVYSDLNHIIVRISPKYASEAEESAILISSHIDTDFSTMRCYALFVVSKAMCRSGLIDRPIEVLRNAVWNCAPDVFTSCTLMDGLCKENMINEDVRSRLQLPSDYHM